MFVCKCVCAGRGTLPQQTRVHLHTFPLFAQNTNTCTICMYTHVGVEACVLFKVFLLIHFRHSSSSTNERQCVRVSVVKIRFNDCAVNHNDRLLFWPLGCTACMYIITCTLCVCLLYGMCTCDVHLTVCMKAALHHYCIPAQISQWSQGVRAMTSCLSECMVSTYSYIHHVCFTDRAVWWSSYSTIIVGLLSTISARYSVTIKGGMLVVSCACTPFILAMAAFQQMVTEWQNILPPCCRCRSQKSPCALEEICE